MLGCAFDLGCGIKTHLSKRLRAELLSEGVEKERKRDKDLWGNVLIIDNAYSACQRTRLACFLLTRQPRHCTGGVLGKSHPISPLLAPHCSIIQGIRTLMATVQGILLAEMLLSDDRKLFDSGLHNQCPLDKDGVHEM